MVCLIRTAACERGDHGACNGGDKAPAGNFGGTMCTCSCHRKPVEREKAVPDLFKKIDREIRNDALEEAAKEAEQWADNYNHIDKGLGNLLQKVADAIRALKDT